MQNSAALTSRGHPVITGLSERDRTLIQQIKKGSAEAFETLRGFYEGLVSALIRQKLNWPGEAQVVEDIGQDVWMQVHTSIGEFEERSSFGTWLSTITRNKCFDHLRKKRKHKGEVSITSLKDDAITDGRDSFFTHPTTENLDDFVEQVRPITDSVYAGWAETELTVIKAHLDGLVRREIALKYNMEIDDVNRIVDSFRDKCRKMRIEGLTEGERMRAVVKAKRRKRNGSAAPERGDPEEEK